MPNVRVTQFSGTFSEHASDARTTSEFGQHSGKITRIVPMIGDVNVARRGFEKEPLLSLKAACSPRHRNDQNAWKARIYSIPARICVHLLLTAQNNVMCQQKQRTFTTERGRLFKSSHFSELSFSPPPPSSRRTCTQTSHC